MIGHLLGVQANGFKMSEYALHSTLSVSMILHRDVEWGTPVVIRRQYIRDTKSATKYPKDEKLATKYTLTKYSRDKIIDKQQKL